MGVVNKIDYLLAILKNKSLELQLDQIELDDKEIIRLGLDTTDILQVNIDHIEWQITEPLETYEGTKVKLPKINVYWDDGNITEETINYTMIDNVSYYLEAGNYELKAVYNNFTSANALSITVIKKELIGIEWETTDSITIQQNHRAYLPYIKLNYNDGNSKRISSQSPGIILNDSEYYLELGEHILTATYKEFTTNELIINVVEEEIIDEDTHDYSQDYLTFEALEDGVFSFSSDIKYSYNNSEWMELNAGTNTCDINKGDIIRIKNDADNYIDCSITKSLKFLAYGSFDKSRINCYRFFKNSNIVNAKNIILGSKLDYREMFYGCTSLVNAPELPAITLSGSCYYCYSSMFEGCTSLVNTPELPATTLSGGCYKNMFKGCTSLVNAPELPATTLSSYCYNGMFQGCTSLVNAPELPATTLSSYCYSFMFQGCTSLVNAPELPATTLSASCYSSMFSDCTSLVNAPELPATTLSGECYSDMFNGCISLVNAPELPATTLSGECYSDMFNGCISLVNAPELPATTLSMCCYRSMFNGCTSLVNAPELPATTLSDECYSGMFSGCTNLVNAPELPATRLTNNCYDCMFRGCTSLVNAPELPATTLSMGCYYGMFSGCISLVNAPELPATTLSVSCYGSMFSGCISLVNAPELPAYFLASNCYGFMFKGCNINYIKILAKEININYCNNFCEFNNSIGTFVKLAGVDFEDGIIPKGWTVQEIDPDTGEIVNEYINE